MNYYGIRPEDRELARELEWERQDEEYKIKMHEENE